jgi:hypothetical protein
MKKLADENTVKEEEKNVEVAENDKCPLKTSTAS